MKIYGDRASGNCHKVKLIGDILHLPYDWIDVDILAGETRTAEFLALNPNGKIPLLQLDDGRLLWESNAIINYLAVGSCWLPTDAFSLAKVQQWQFFEQYSHEPCIAVARFIARYQGVPADRLDEFNSLQAGGHRALQVMESQLKRTDFIAGPAATTADISLFAYTHVAHEGGFDLGLYPAIQDWLARLSSFSDWSQID